MSIQREAVRYILAAKDQPYIEYRNKLGCRNNNPAEILLGMLAIQANNAWGIEGYNEIYNLEEPVYNDGVQN